MKKTLDVNKLNAALSQILTERTGSKVNVTIRKEARKNERTG